MPKYTVFGAESGFHLVSDWHQPDRERLVLRWRNQDLITSGDNDPTLYESLKKLVVWLVAYESGYDGEERMIREPSKVGITNITIHRAFRPECNINEFYWLAHVEGTRGALFVELPVVSGGQDRLEAFIVAAYEGLTQGAN